MKLNRRTAMGALIGGAAAGPDMAKQAMQSMQENKWSIKEYDMAKQAMQSGEQKQIMDSFSERIYGDKTPGYDRNYLEQEKKYLEEILSDGYDAYKAYYGNYPPNYITEAELIQINNLVSVSDSVKEQYKRQIVIKRYIKIRKQEAKAKLEQILKQLVGL